ncbi:MAG TPA: hypothetical protein VIQ31_18250 [Phormidium sp.]
MALNYSDITLLPLPFVDAPEKLHPWESYGKGLVNYLLVETEATTQPPGDAEKFLGNHQQVLTTPLSKRETREE